jgi:integrase
MKDNNINEKSKSQNDNWITWEQVLNVKKNLKNIVDTFANNKFITAIQFDYLLGYLILSLYTDIPPRRNQDYIDMYFVNNYTDGLDSNRNYLDWANKKLVFLKYKTAKKYGKQVIDISDNKELLDALTLYLKFHPLIPSQNLKKLPKNTNFKLLVYSNGSYLDAVNSITRILNKIFGRNIGSSMLRHIYLTDKYKNVLDDMKEDAIQMGTSENMVQNQYVKN